MKALPDLRRDTSVAKRGGLVLFIMALTFGFGTLLLQAQNIPIPGGDIRNCHLECTANDVQLMSAFVGDANGNPLPTCTNGQATSAYLYFVLHNHSNKTVYVTLLGADLYINGDDTGEDIIFCSEDVISGHSIVTVMNGIVSWTCGQSMELANITVAWRSSSNATCANTTKCNDIPPGQCGNTPSIIVETPQIADFSFDCAPEPRTIDFVNLSSGGTPPLTFYWDFGDGTFSTDKNPSHTFPAYSTYFVGLLVTDVHGDTKSIVKPVDVSQCCSFSATCPSSVDPGIYDCRHPIPLPALTVTEFETTYGVDIGDNPCGTIVILYQDSPTEVDICNTTQVTRTYTIFDDLDGNMILDQGESYQICTRTYMFTKDTESPVWSQTMPANVTVECDAVPVAPTNISAMDNCDEDVEVTYSETKTNGACTDSYTLQRVWEARDDCDNVRSHTQLITVRDTKAPVWSQTMPADVTSECDAVPIAPANIAATDNCDISVVVTYNETKENGACTDSYILRRVWVARDNCDNTLTHTQLITVRDTKAPVWSQTMPADVTSECDAVPIAPANITATDNCDISVAVTYNETKENGACTDSYILRRVWVARDNCDNTLTHTQLITVRDTKAPVWSQTMPADVTVECDAVPIAPANITATDNCDIYVTFFYRETKMEMEDNCTDSYFLQRRWTARDNCDNTITHTQLITVRDTKAPVWSQTMPADVTVECDAVPIAPANIAATDNCDISVAVTYNETKYNGACADSYILRRRWTARDNCDNVRSHIQLITVRDTKAPVWSQTMPADVTVECDAVPIAPANIAATDNCDISVAVTYNETKEDGACTDSYTLRRVWEARDNCDNTITHTQFITVRDTKAPVWSQTMPADVTVECGAVPVLPTNISATDNCDVSVLVTFQETKEDGNCVLTYTLVRKWTATDNCSNAITHTQRVTVLPPPTAHFVNPPARIVMSCMSEAPQPTILAYTNNQTGVCLISGEVMSTIEGSHGVCGGLYIEIWTFTDVCGRSISHQREIEITPAPQASFLDTPEDYYEIECPAGDPAAPTALAYSNGMSGLCEISGSVMSTLNLLPDACLKAYLETWTFTDECQRTITYSRIIVVNISWEDVSIGPYPGSAIYGCPASGDIYGPFSITAYGYGSHTADIMHFVYTPLSGDGQIIARFGTGTGATFGGIMIRETLVPGSKKVGIRTQNYTSNNIEREVRLTTGGMEITKQWPRYHKWLRLDRIGDVFHAYSSPNGTDWWFLAAVTIDMEECVYIGVFAEGINGYTSGTVSMDNIQVNPGTPKITVVYGGLSAFTDPNQTVDFDVYPNPLDVDELNVDLSAYVGQSVRVIVRNMQGMIVGEENLGEIDLPMQVITMKDVPDGMYIIQVVASDKRKSARKIIVMRN